jgi:uncharacterized protein YutE (UPF0331/DUF86 family)
MIVERLPEAERDVLALLAENYEGRGFRFIPYPSKDLLPEFLGSYRPDGIAVGDNENIIVEVKFSGSPSDTRLDEIASRVAAHPGWRFLVYYVGDDLKIPPPIETLESSSLIENLYEIERLREGGHPRAAFVLAWSLFEAIFRTVEASQEKPETKPQSPGRVVEQLEMLGMLSEVEAKRLRALIPVRNHIVHGGATTHDLTTDLDVMVPLLRKLIETIAPSPRPSSGRR